VEAALIRADRRTGMTKVMGAFRDCANATKALCRMEFSSELAVNVVHVT